MTNENHGAVKMRRGVLQMKFAAVAVCLLAAQAAVTGNAATARRSDAAALVKSRRFEFTYVVRVPATQGHELRLWVPLPHSDEFQTISRLRIESPVPYKVERADRGNREGYFALTGRELTKPVEIRIVFDGLRRERRVELLTPDPRGPVPAAFRLYLRPDRMIPLSGVIGQISRQETNGISNPQAKARKLYEYVITHMRYDKTGTGWGRGDAVWACDSHRGNCTDFHSLFIGLARAAGIPARFKIGFPLPEGQHSGTIPGYHCWAEFYLNGVGWVPIDASESWQHPERHDFYFGSLDANRVLFTVGRDLRLDPPQKEQPVNFLVYPYAELDGKVFEGVQHAFSFRDLD